MGYEPLFRKQLTGTPCGHANCNMAAAAHLADRATLGLIRKTPDQMRTLSGTAANCLDANQLNDGTSQADALRALAKCGLVPTQYDRTDGFDASEFRAAIQSGRGAIVAGDYDRVPVGLRGDREFLNFHGIFANEWRASVVIPPRYEFKGYTGPAYRTWDSLNDGRIDNPSRKVAPKGPIWWPAPVMHAFAEAMATGSGNFLAIVADLGSATVRVSTGKANVRDVAALTGAIIATRFSGAKLEASPLPDIGGAAGSGDTRWFRVWLPELARVGFMHASVITVTGG